MSASINTANADSSTISPQRRKRRRGPGSDHKSVSLTITTSVVALAFLLPVIWLIVGSFRPTTEIFSSLYPLSWDILIPKTLYLDNYIAMLTGAFGRALLVSFTVCLLSVALGLLICSMAAYALAVLQFPGRSLVFALVVISFLVPFEAIAIPLSQIFSGWNLNNTLLGLVLPGVGNGLAIFNLRQHFMGVPTSYREAAMIDGAREHRVFGSIYIPLSGAALANSSMLIFLGQWSAYLWPLLVVSDSRLQVAPIALAQTFGEKTFDFGQNFAGTVVLALIPAVMMLFIQRSFGGLSVNAGEK